jgi:hypothetical protein
MGEALGAAVALTLFIMLTGVTFLALLDVWEVRSTEASVVTLRRVERLNTMVSVTATAPSGSGYDTFTATVSNPGETAIGDFTQMDLIADYTDTNSDRVSARLDHVSGVVAANQWMVSSIAPDTRDPNSWNPGEVATLEFKVDPAVSSAVSGAMVLSTPFGVSDTTYFGC